MVKSINTLLYDINTIGTFYTYKVEIDKIEGELFVHRSVSNLMKHKEKVSVIIPYYNTKEYIDECLNSILAQSYTNLEIIIINDGSDDDDTAYIESILDDSRIIYLKNNKKKGVGYSRNKGMAAANGEFVFFLDSDDILSTQAIEYLVGNIGNKPAITGKTTALVKPSDLEDEKNSARSFVKEEMVQLKNGWDHFQSGSILNVLISKKFLTSRKIQFIEKLDGFTDLAVIIPLVLAERELLILNKKTYFKRFRNDPITNPALSQRPLNRITEELIQIYLMINEKYNDCEQVKRYIDSFFLNYYRNNSIQIFSDKAHFDYVVNQLTKPVQLLGTIQNSQPSFIKREIKYLKEEKKEKLKKSLKLRKEIRDFRNAIKGFTRLKRYIYEKLFLRFPLKEKYIIFESFLGRNYSDSPRNIYEYIVENNLDFTCIWVFNDKKRKIPGNAKIVKRFSLKYYYYFAVSKYWVNNMRQPLHLVKKEGNVFLETWHGTPLKKLVFDMKDIYSANPNYKRDFYLQSRAWDYLLAPNRYSSEIFRRAFKFDKEMLEYGYPRNDILYAPDKNKRAERIKKSIGIPEDKKVILYAPTWRDDEYFEPGKYKFNLKLDLRKMKEMLGSEYVVALRMHYFIANDINVEGLEGFAYNLSKYNDIAELYLITDLLITDYSSVFFDYANLKRPILFYTYDLEKYRDQLRGFYLDFEKDLPGPMLQTSEEVIEAIKNIEQIKRDYSNLYETFYEEFCGWHDGKSTERVVRKVFFDADW